MSKAKENKPSRGKKFIKFLLIKFPIVLLVLALVFYMALKMAERYPVPLKEGMEEYISGLSGAHASIGKLEKFTFVPDLDVEFQDITLHRQSNAAKIDLSVEHIELTIPFWAAFLGHNRFKNILIENAKSDEDVLLPKAFFIERVEIIDKEGPEQFGSFVVATGTYNEKDLYFEAKLKKIEQDYTLFKPTPFSLTLGESILTGNIRRNLRGIQLEDTIFEVSDEKSAASDYVLVKSGEYIKDNPLACLIIKGEGAECKKYLTDETNSE